MPNRVRSGSSPSFNDGAPGRAIRADRDAARSAPGWCSRAAAAPGADEHERLPLDEMPHADARPRRDDVAHAPGLVDDAEAAMRVELAVVKHRMPGNRPNRFRHVGSSRNAPARADARRRANANGDQKNPSASA
nr:hypothetical protein [Burkholderia ubonensis]